MGIFKEGSEKCKLWIDYYEHKINFDICAKMLELNRRLTSDEIEEIVLKNLELLKEQV